ncbi:MAG TPA: hypothetical protein VN776_04250 [Terracidiphilus sp.]|nr:hypothetical protein [Terracidiphilus sp.]
MNWRMVARCAAPGLFWLLAPEFWLLALPVWLRLCCFVGQAIAFCGLPLWLFLWRQRLRVECDPVEHLPRHLQQAASKPPGWKSIGYPSEFSRDH